MDVNKKTIELPVRIQSIIEEMNNKNIRPEIRTNYLFQLKDIRDTLTVEIENFEKSIKR
jgi:hypothetical protein